MKEKFIFMFLIAMVALIGLSVIYAADANELTNKTTLSIKVQYPITIGELVNTISTKPAFKNYDYTTLNWLKGFGSGYNVFITDDYYIVMNSSDSNKLSGHLNTGLSNSTKSSYTADVSFDVLENKSLGNGLSNVIHVENIEILSKNV